MKQHRSKRSIAALLAATLLLEQGCGTTREPPQEESPPAESVRVGHIEFLKAVPRVVVIRLQPEPLEEEKYEFRRSSLGESLVLLGLVAIIGIATRGNFPPTGGSQNRSPAWQPQFSDLDERSLPDPAIRVSEAFLPELKSLARAMVETHKDAAADEADDAKQLAVYRKTYRDAAVFEFKTGRRKIEWLDYPTLSYYPPYVTHVLLGARVIFPRTGQILWHGRCNIEVPQERADYDQYLNDFKDEEISASGARKKNIEKLNRRFREGSDRCARALLDEFQRTLPPASMTRKSSAGSMILYPPRTDHFPCQDQPGSSPVRTGSSPVCSRSGDRSTKDPMERPLQCATIFGISLYCSPLDLPSNPPTSTPATH